MPEVSGTKRIFISSIFSIRTYDSPRRTADKEVPGLAPAAEVLGAASDPAPHVTGVHYRSQPSELTSHRRGPISNRTVLYSN